MNMERRPFATAISVFVSLTFAGIAIAQSKPSEAPSAPARNLMMKASQSNIAEIEEGRLAMTHSRNPQVQALGNRLVQDHTKAEATLEALAATMDMKLPTKPDPTAEQDISKLEALKGRAFDDVFDKGEVSSHEKAIAELQQSASNVHNAPLEAWIEENVPVLEQHLDLARTLPTASSRRTASTAASAKADVGTSGARVAPGSADGELLTKSMQGNLAEIELGRIAVTHSTSPVVQGLGTRIAQDGSKGVANLQALSGMLHVALTSKPSAAQERQVAELTKLHGPQFDARFQKIALEDEQQFLKAFQSGVSASQNKAVKSTIKNMIPVVQEHIQIAQAIPGQYPHRTARAVEAAHGAPHTLR